MKPAILFVCALPALSACALLDRPAPDAEGVGEPLPLPSAMTDTADTPTGPRPVARPGTSGGTGPDRVTETVPQSASDAAGVLGRTVASLGNPAESGIWIKTPLVSAPGTGRLRHDGTGRTITVDLIPLDADAGAGSRMSLAAFQALGVPLTDLPEVEVLAGG